MLEQWLERLIIQWLKAMQVEVSYFEFVESSRICNYGLRLCCPTCAIQLGMAWVRMSYVSQHIST